MTKKVIVISSCRECESYLRYTESDWYYKKMPKGKGLFTRIDDVSKIHPLCPLQDLEEILKNKCDTNDRKTR